MKRNFVFLGFYENPIHRSQFLQNIQEECNIKVVGSLTLGGLKGLLEEKFEGKEDYLAGAKEFIDLQLEGEAELYSNLFATNDDDVTWVAFDIRPEA